jgi:hypothetical protein
MKDKERVVNERLDPYSGRVFPREARTEKLALLLRQEGGIENIVRTRSWEMVRERCGDSAQNWEEAMSRWRTIQETPKAGGDRNSRPLPKR